MIASLFSLNALAKSSWKLDLEIVHPLNFTFNSNKTSTLSLGKCNLRIVDTWWSAPSCYSSEGTVYNGLTHVYNGTQGTTSEQPYSIQVVGHYSPILNHTPMSPRLRGDETIITNCDDRALIATGYFRKAQTVINIPTDSQGSLTLPMPTDKMAQLLINKVIPETERCISDAENTDPDDLKMPGFVISDDLNSSEALDLAAAISRSTQK